MRIDTRPLEQIALAALGAFVFVLPSLGRDHSQAAFVALVPWTALLMSGRYRRPQAWVIAGFYFAGPVIYRHLFAFGAPVPFLFPLLMVPFFLPFPFAVRFIARRLSTPMALVVPVCWVTTEYLETHLVLGKQCVYMLGYQLAPFGILIQTADLVGFYGPSFLAAAAAGAVCDLGLWAWRRDRGARRRALLAVALLVVAAGFSRVYGVYRLKRLRFKEGPAVALVQPATKRSVDNVLESVLQQSLLTLEHVRPGAAELIIWPENAIMDVIDRPDKYLPDLAFLGSSLDADFIVGAFGKPAADLSRHTNSAYLVDRAGIVRGRYDKRLLVPWAEAVPGQRWLAAVHPYLALRHQLLTSSLLGYGPNGAAGDTSAIFASAGIRLAPLICLETTQGDLAREAALAGADAIVNITSEGRVGIAMQDQLLAISMFRAVETRRAVIRAGNAGVSALISPEGAAHTLLRGAKTGKLVDEAGVLVAKLRLNADPRPSFYTRHGDVFVLANALLASLLVLRGWRRPRQAATAAVAAGG